MRNRKREKMMEMTVVMRMEKRKKKVNIMKRNGR